MIRYTKGNILEADSEALVKTVNTVGVMGKGVATLTPARAMIAELVRRYQALGFECSYLEVQKPAWLLERNLMRRGLRGLDLRFNPEKAEELHQFLESTEMEQFIPALERLQDVATA